MRGGKLGSWRDPAGPPEPGWGGLPAARTVTAKARPRRPLYCPTLNTQGHCTVQPAVDRGV